MYSFSMAITKQLELSRLDAEITATGITAFRGLIFTLDGPGASSGTLDVLGELTEEEKQAIVSVVDAHSVS